MSQKKQHTLSNCGGCQVDYFAVHTLFANVQGVVVNSGLKAQSKLKVKETAMKSAVKHIYFKPNGPFEGIFKVSLAEAQTKVKELNVQRKRRSNGKKSVNVERKHAKKKNKIQDQWAKIDCDLMLGTRQSFTQRLRQRQSLGFESSTEALLRAQKPKNQENLEERYTQVPFTTTSVHFERENLLKEVKNMIDGKKVSVLIFFK